jgi:hypothetical protein
MSGKTSLNGERREKFRAAVWTAFAALVMTASAGWLLSRGNSVWQAPLGTADKGSSTHSSFSSPPARLIPSNLALTSANTAQGLVSDSAYPQSPLYFEPNQGQMDEHVRFLSRNRGYTLFLTSTEAVMVLSKGGVRTRVGSVDEATGKNGAGEELSVVRMRLESANPQALLSGVQELPGTSNYLTGSDPMLWRRNVPHYAKVRYREVYPGIDLVFYSADRKLEYDFIVAPGVDPKTITLALDGLDDLKVDERGDLILRTASGEARLQKPFIYQEKDGLRQEVPGGYVLLPSVRSRGLAGDETGHSYRVGFHVAAYDQSKLLIIDPTLIYFPRIGGNKYDEALGLAVDPLGYAVITGRTSSLNFPPKNAGPISRGAVSDVFVTKLGPNGDIVYSTYLGGNKDDEGNGIALDPSGNIYVVGQTASTDFPRVAALQTLHGGGTFDAFMAKLNSTGTTLLYSTYLGGTKDDYGGGIAVDNSGAAHVAGSTLSTDFPTANPVQAASAGDSDVFVAKLNPSGSSLEYSTYLGGSKRDGFLQGVSIALDVAGNAYITAETLSLDFPTTPGAFQIAFQGGVDFGDTFVAKLDASGTALMYATYLGGSGDEFEDLHGNNVAVDGQGHAYVTGVTNSQNFPVVGPLQPTRSGSFDAFVTKLAADGSGLVYSTYLGGLMDDGGNGIAVDATGGAYVVGFTDSLDFPTKDSLQPDNAGSWDGFLAKLSPDGSLLVHSTYLGSVASDFLYGAATGACDTAYAAGFTFFNKGDASVLKISENPPLLIQTTSLPDAEIGVNYQAPVSANGGCPPYTFAIVEGTLPAGLALSPDGAMSGTPTPLAKNSTVTVEVTDNDGITAAHRLKIRIFKTLEIITKSLKEGKVGKKYSASLKAKAGKKPISWSPASGTLPPNLALDGATGKITGIPAGPGATLLTFLATDPLGGTAQKELTLTVK